MPLLAKLMQLLGLIAFCAYIWLVVVAFKRSALWGVLVLLFSPIAAIVFAIKNWSESKKPFLIYVGSGVAGLAIFFSIVAFLGAPMFKMAQEMSERELTGEEAAGYMEEHMDRWEESGVLSPQEEAELREMRGAFREMMQEAEAEADADTAAPDVALTRTDIRAPAATARSASLVTSVAPPTESTTPVAVNRDVISVREIGEHVGEKMRVVMTDGNELVGRFVGQSGDELKFERRLTSGSLVVHVSKSDIRSLQRVKRR
jgi:hypothetical protein